MQGLTTKKAQEHLNKYGENRIRTTKQIHPLQILFHQFTSPLILVLVGAAAVSLTIGFFPGQESHVVDVILIMVIVSLSGLAGFFQEYQAEKAIEALQKMAAPKAKVIRDGKEREIQTTQIVPDDIVIVEGGDIIPADAQLVQVLNLQVNEAPLTGESQPINKEQGDSIFMNTFVDAGKAKAKVNRTGMHTKMGEIASQLEKVEQEKTPFQKEMRHFSRQIFYLILGVTVMIFAVGFFKYGILLALLTAISLAVAAIPEGLPAVVTLTLALGGRKLARKNALIRKLSVTESLGSVNVICTDKTGTLTKNEMSVRKFFFNGRVHDADEVEGERIEQLVKCGVFCNNSSIVYNKSDEKKYVGDQTEVALRRIGDQMGLEKDRLDEEYERVHELSFNSDRKRMSVIIREKEGYTVYAKGAPEILIDHCSRIKIDGEEKKLTNEQKKRILEQNKAFADNALRVLGFAYKSFDRPKGGTEEVEENLVWLGLQAMYDPPREEVKQALKECATAGIRVVMITGDNPSTARAIATEVGIQSKEVIEGKVLDGMPPKTLSEQLDNGVNIFARTSPFHKQQILKVLQKTNIVAMTGDGVNDALAVKNADVGIAMGIKGTEVTKESSDMILLDDNFATITTAIRFGRGIFSNIQKFVKYLFACNFAEIGVIFLATLFLSLEAPILLPVQILWINLLTDGLPALALGVDPPPPNVMQHPPRKKGASIIDTNTKGFVGVVGSVMIALLISVFLFMRGEGFEVAQTMLFTGFVVFEFVKIGVIRYQEKIGVWSNPWLVWALITSLGLQIAVVYMPFHHYLGIVPLDMEHWGIIVVSAAFGFLLSVLLTRQMQNLLRLKS